MMKIMKIKNKIMMKNSKTLMSSKDEIKNENEDDDETIRDLNDILHEIINKSKYLKNK